MRILFVAAAFAFFTFSAQAKVEQLSAKTHELTGKLIQKLNRTWILQLNPDTHSSFDVVIENGDKTIPEKDKWIFKDKFVKMKVAVKKICSQPCVVTALGKPDRLLSASSVKTYSGVVK